VAALVVVATGAAFFISCQAEDGEPAPAVAPSTDSPDYYVHGYCYDQFNQLTDGITCKIYCETCDKWVYTEDTSGTISNGYYKCEPEPPAYTPHDGHTVRAEGYDGPEYWGCSGDGEIVENGIQLDIYEGQEP
jgi:hypothetical protein